MGKCTLPWLTLCVSLTGLRDARMAGKTLFLGVTEGVSSASVFPEKTSI